MWVLEPERGAVVAAKRYYLPVGTWTLGRKEPCHVVMEEEKSVSRCHAALHVVYEGLQGVVPPILRVEDLESKFGTWTSETERLASKTPVRIRDGDRIRFGGKAAKFYRVRRLSLNVVITSSCPKGTEEVAGSVGARVAQECSEDTTHLIMDELKPTMKLVLALLYQARVVTSLWLRTLSERSRLSDPLPTPEAFTPHFNKSFPELEETFLSPNPIRQRLFAGRTLVFMDHKQFKIFKKVVTCAGGVAEEVNCEWTQTPELASRPMSHLFVDPGWQDGKAKLAMTILQKRLITQDKLIVSILKAKPLGRIGEDVVEEIGDSEEAVTAIKKQVPVEDITENEEEDRSSFSPKRARVQGEIEGVMMSVGDGWFTRRDRAALVSASTVAVVEEIELEEPVAVEGRHGFHKNTVARSTNERKTL